MTTRQKKFIFWLSTGRRVAAWGNICSKNPRLLFGEIDTDPRQLKQPELDEFLTWWRDLEERHAADGMQIQLRLAGLEEFPTLLPPGQK